MIQAVLLLCCVLLSPMAAFPRHVQKEDLTIQSSFREPEAPPNTLSRQIPLPTPRACQDLLQEGAILAPLPEYLSNLAMRVALEEVGCPTEAHILEQQLFRMGGKDITEILIREIQKRKTAEGISNTKAILWDMGGSPGGLGRVRRSATLPEACKHENGWLYYELALLLIDFAEKLPPSDLVTEFKASATSASQICTAEAWEHVTEVGQQLMESPELKNFSMPVEDQMNFATRLMDIIKRVIWNIMKSYFLSFF
nr:apolipoprotein F-like [Dasypus novemcinctus]XP_012383592.2 apolipoprotein F-like [Dasypus novemcinctus]